MPPQMKDQMTPDIIKMGIESLFRCMSATDTGSNVRDALTRRFPEHEDFILTLKRDDEHLEFGYKKPPKVKPVSSFIIATAPSKTVKKSKLDQSMELYDASADKSRPVIIDLFCTKLSFSKSMASTYYYLVKAKYSQYLLANLRPQQ